MFVILKFVKKRRLFWHAQRFVRSSEKGCFTEISCPQPKNTRQFKKLIKMLNQYSGMIIYPKGYYKKGMPAPYPTSAYKRRLIMTIFLKYAQKNNPDCAVINGCGRVNEEYLLNLSSYVGKIILYNTQQNDALQLKALSHSGTPIIYNNEVPAGAVVLDLNERNPLCFNHDVKCFGLNLIYDLKNLFPPLPTVFKGLDDLCIWAALSELWNLDNPIDTI